MFIHYNNKLVNTDNIQEIDITGLADKGFIRIRFRGTDMETVSGPEAFDIVMRVCPSAIEGRRFKFNKNKWVIHNLIGHPAMQILSWLGKSKAALWIHDKTIPIPQVK